MMYEVLRQLDEWRHLPAYQLERRVDVLFGMFLPKVIEKRFGVCVDEVIPEFPLHKELLRDRSIDPSEASSHHSVNVDFAVFGHKGDKKRLLLVELKTDLESLRKDQLENMVAGGAVGPEALFRGIIEASRHSGSKHKYAHLIWRLLELECLELGNRAEFTNLCLEKDRPGLTRVYKELRVGKDWCNACVDLVAILPNQPEEPVPEPIKVTSFDRFANVLEHANQPFVPEDVRAFVAHVRNWAGVRAGRVTPWAR